MPKLLRVTDPRSAGHLLNRLEIARQKVTLGSPNEKNF